MTYKILNIDQEKNVIEILVTWDDASTYTKRMMADTTSEATVKSSVEAWLKDYLKMKDVEATQPAKQDLTSTKNKVFTVKKIDLETPVIEEV